MASVVWAAWLALGVGSLVARGRGVSGRLRWLGDTDGWTLALSVASFAPALAPEASLPLQAALMLVAGAGLLRLMHALDSRPVGQGVVAGLGLIALLLDSLSGGAWARLGALGHGASADGIGVLYGTLALLWGLIVVRAWLRIEGNPLGAALGMGALALWLGWKGQTPALGWGATASALALGGWLLRREHRERRRVRLSLQNRLVRVVRRASNADLALTGGALVGLCLLALWLSGAPTIPTPQLGVHAGWQAAILGVWLLGSASACRRKKFTMPPFTGAAVAGVALIAFLGGAPLATVALGTLIFHASMREPLQEHPRRASNLSTRTGGNS
ncbi:MAG: hypothetical protein WHS44_10485 [Fimbriimonadales bacterium]|nr:MAG: hypothetical protein KatS3mg018_2244 [Fimbriimonadales bacterium]